MIFVIIDQIYQSLKNQPARVLAEDGAGIYYVLLPFQPNSLAPKLLDSQDGTKPSLSASV